MGRAGGGGEALTLYEAIRMFRGRDRIVSVSYPCGLWGRSNSQRPVTPENREVLIVYGGG